MGPRQEMEPRQAKQVPRLAVGVEELVAAFWRRAWATQTSGLPGVGGYILGMQPGRAPHAADPLFLCKGSCPKELVPSQRALGGTLVARSDHTHSC